MCYKVTRYYETCNTDGQSVILKCQRPETCGPPTVKRYGITNKQLPELCPSCFHADPLFIDSVPQIRRDQILESNVYKRGTSEATLEGAELLWKQAETKLTLTDELHCFSSQLDPEEGLSHVTKLMIAVLLDILSASFWHDVIEKKISPNSLNSIVRDHKTSLASIPLRPEYLKFKVNHPSITTLAADDRDCTICRDPLGVPNGEGVIESLVRTSCNHHFGDKCLYHWIQQNESCPICRGSLLTFEESQKIYMAEFAAMSEDKALPTWLMKLLGHD